MDRLTLLKLGMLMFMFMFYISSTEEQYNAKIQMLASMPNSGMGNNNMRKDNRDRGDRSSMQRGGSMSGSSYNNNNKLNRGGAYPDNDGWIQTGSNKSRGGNNSTSFDPSKFRATSVSKVEFLKALTMNSIALPTILMNCIIYLFKEHRRYYERLIGYSQAVPMEIEYPTTGSNKPYK